MILIACALWGEALHVGELYFDIASNSLLLAVGKRLLAWLRGK